MADASTPHRVRRAVRRALLHPLALALPVTAVAVAAAALTAAGAGGPALALLALCGAGLSAGYANSGST
ncbi:hypothetical protein AB0M28_06250 [Streptomyces sp. NPDC051940]|uniref:hypothetical protein n=1 Tax=Streptomyces sp. NPDC051940 TaxID=3155675 RepID=UPI003443D714